MTMRDERLSSFEAERRLGRMPRGRSGGRAVADPAQCVPRAYRSRGRERHPPGRAGRAGGSPGGRMSIRGGRGPRDDQDDAGNYRNGYHRTGRYGRGPGDQRKYERYGSRNGGIGGILRFIVFLGAARGRRPPRDGHRGPPARPRRHRAVGRRQPRRAPDPVRRGHGPRGHRRRRSPPPADGLGRRDRVHRPVRRHARRPSPRGSSSRGSSTSERAFLFQARVDDLGTKLTAGQFGARGQPHARPGCRRAS